MSVFRVNKTNNYTVMSNHHLRNKELSLKGKGLLSLMLSLPPDWDYTIKGLCKITAAGETTIRSTLKELTKLGYLKVTKKYGNETSSCRIEYEYDVYEEPQDVSCQDDDFQGVENLHLELLHVENQGQINTDIINKEDKVLKGVFDEDLQSSLNNDEHSSKTNNKHFYYLKDLDIQKLKELKQEILENRVNGKLTYRDLQIKYKLIDKLEFDTPLECDSLIKQKSTLKS